MTIKKKQRKLISKQRKSSRSKPSIKPVQRQSQAKPLSLEETVAKLNGETFHQVITIKRRKTKRQEPVARPLELPEKKPPKRVRKPIDTRPSKPAVKVSPNPKELKIPLAGRLPIIDLISTAEFYCLDKKKPRKREINKVISISKY